MIVETPSIDCTNSENTVRKNQRYVSDDVMTSVQGPDLVCDVTARMSSELLDRASSQSDNNRASSSGDNDDSNTTCSSPIVCNLDRASSSTDSQATTNRASSSTENSRASALESNEENVVVEKESVPPDVVILPSGLRSAFQLEIQQVLQRRSGVIQPKADVPPTEVNQPKSDCSPNSLMAEILTEVVTREQRENDVEVNKSR